MPLKFPFILSVICPCLFNVQHVDGRVIYVDQSATGDNDGSEWASAFIELQSALAAATGGDEVRVAEGVYLPDYDVGAQQHTGNRSLSFTLKPDVTLNGGFPSGGGASDVRDPALHATVLSGDLQNDDKADFTGMSDNARHVITALGEGAVLDGFEIRGGYADGSDLDQQGGGMLINSASPTIRQCVFRRNAAEGTLGAGGAIAIVGEGANPVITNATFINNVALAQLDLRLTQLGDDLFRCVPSLAHDLSSIPDPEIACILTYELDPFLGEGHLRCTMHHTEQ